MEDLKTGHRYLIRERNERSITEVKVIEVTDRHVKMLRDGGSPYWLHREFDPYEIIEDLGKTDFSRDKGTPMIPNPFQNAGLRASAQFPGTMTGQEQSARSLQNVPIPEIKHLVEKQFYRVIVSSVCGNVLSDNTFKGSELADQVKLFWENRTFAPIVMPINVKVNAIKTACSIAEAVEILASDGALLNCRYDPLARMTSEARKEEIARRLNLVNG